MAVSTQDIKNRYPLPASNFRVAVLFERLVVNVPLEMESAVTMISCTEVLGLNMEIESVTYRHGMSFIMGQHIIPAVPKEVRLSLLGGVVKDRKYLSDWMKISYPHLLPKPISLTRKRDILIDLCDEEGKPLIRWTVVKAMPVKLEAPTFNAATTEVAFERLDLIAHELKVDFNL